jgi:hypothetical protein
MELPEELPLPPLLPELGVEDELVPCVFTVEAVVDLVPPSELVAIPATLDAAMVDVLVGWGLFAGSSQVNMTPGMVSITQK